MISNLRELNETINSVVNRIVEYGTQNTISGNRYIGYDNVSDLISEENYYQYFDLITDELAGREEVLDLETDDHEFDCNFALAYCPNYQWTEGDEEIFGCSFDEWKQNYEFKAIAKPLSFSRMSEIGEAAIDYVLDSSDKVIEDLTEKLGITMSELEQLKIHERASSQKKPAYSYEVLDYKGKKAANYKDFDKALSLYKALGNMDLKTLSVIIPEGSPHEGAVAILQQQSGKDVLCNSRQDLPHIKAIRDLFIGTDVEVSFLKAQAFVNSKNPIRFFVWEKESGDVSSLGFNSFEDALKAYKSLKPHPDNALSYLFSDEQGSSHGALLIQYSERNGRDTE